MDLNKIIEMAKDADSLNDCRYTIQVSTRNPFITRGCLINLCEWSSASVISRNFDITDDTTEDDLLAFFNSCDFKQLKLNDAIAARDRLNAEIAELGGETLICNEVAK